MEIITRIGRRLAHKFRFSYFTIEDMEQEAFIAAIDGLERYDESRPLENFLSVHIHNRLFNLKRNKFCRPDTPCLKCPLNAWVKGSCTAFENRSDCEIFHKWEVKTQEKITLHSHKESDIDQMDNEEELDKVEAKEIFNLIDKQMPLAFREDWIRYYNKLKLSKTKRIEVIKVIKEILGNNNICPKNLNEENFL